ncbi:CcmD family protein [Halorussus halophilus]
MEPLLLAGYTALFVAFFGYVVHLQRRMSKVESRVADLRD